MITPERIPERLDRPQAIFWWIAGTAFVTKTALTSAVSIALFMRRERPPRTLWMWSAGFAVTFTAFWMTREEGVWMLAPVALLLVPVALRARREPLRVAFERLALVVVPLLTLLIALAATAQINRVVYGWRTIVELESPEFLAAYGSLARIEHPPADRHVPVPRSALAIAYTVSPAARELQPSLDGPIGAGWRANSCAVTGVCDEIGGGWFLWALRQSTEAAGHYRSGATARAYYLRLASEVDAACDAQRIACGPRRDTLIPPVALSDLRPMAREFLDLCVRAASLDDYNLFTQANYSDEGALVEDYRFVTDSPYVSAGRRRFDGWLIAPGATSIAVYSGAVPDPQADLHFVPSPDLAPALLAAGRTTAGAAHGRFHLLTTCLAACSLRVAGPGSELTTVPLDAATPNFTSAHVLYHLEAVDDHPNGIAATDGFKTAAMNAILTVYRRLGVWLLAASVVLLLIELVGGLRRNPPACDDNVLVGIALAIGSCAYIGILAIVATLSFPTENPEYESVVYPVMIYFAAVVLAARLPTNGT